MSSFLRDRAGFSNTPRRRAVIVLSVSVGIVVMGVSQAAPLPPPSAENPDAHLSYTAEQAERGRIIYRDACSQCHGENLNNGEFGPPLTGGNFRQHWRGRPVLDLYERVRNTMPPAAANSLGDPAYRDVVAYILLANRVPGDGSEMPVSSEEMRAQLVPQ